MKEKKMIEIKNEIRKIVEIVFKKHFSGSFTISYIGESDEGLLLRTYFYDHFIIFIEHKNGMIRTYLDSGEKIDIEITAPIEYRINVLYDLFKKVEEELLLRMEDKYIEKYIYNNGGENL